jgi:hypothetical protein
VTEAQPDLLHDMAATSFGGVTCAQFWIDFILWENVLNDNPQVEAIVEIGTWEGGFSWFLWAQAQAREIDFITFDAVKPKDPPLHFVQLDVWANPKRVEAVIRARPVALFCDGGNKPRELQTFAPICDPDSVILVHDWGTETHPADVPDGLREIYGNWCDTVGSITRVFKHGS